MSVAGDVLKLGARLRDRRGVLWTLAEDYQESDKSAPGWMSIVSDNGETMTIPEALERFGHFPLPSPHPWETSPPSGLVFDVLPAEGS